ncbi:hypothetical protein MANES_11G060263v8 [Manihot esculenta]|uniref:Uncharacterized protein n=1 Tax=Manihot esculenta TaxID=3983 RepID=A0ACB7GYD9_MANES|nr:hypothetical protein MANES_11G060263v8 [Manihot esculenta]
MVSVLAFSPEANISPLSKSPQPNQQHRPLQELLSLYQQVSQLGIPTSPPINHYECK